MDKASMTIDQLRERSLLVSTLEEAGWVSAIEETVFESGIDMSPEALYDYDNQDAVLSLAYYAEAPYLLIVIASKQEEDYVAFRCYLEDTLEALLRTILANQSTLSMDTYPEVIKQVCQRCNHVYMEVEGEPLYKIEPEEDATDRPDLELMPDESDMFDLDEEDESAEDETWQRVENILSCATAMSRFAQEHLRLAILMKKAGKFEPDASTNPLDAGIVLKNSCQWIQQRRCDLVVLMPIHDGTTRDPERGVAYFDPTVTHPEREGTYPADASVKDSPHMVYEKETAVGGLVEDADRIEIFNPDQLTDEEQKQFITKNINKLIARKWKKYHSDACIDESHGNPIHSIRIQDLVDQVLSVSVKDDAAGSGSIDVAQQVQALDGIDRAFLNNEALARRFWDLVQEKIPEPVCEQLRTDVRKAANAPL